VDIGGTRILYLPPPATDLALSLAPPGLETTSGVLSITFTADDGELASAATATATVTVVPLPRAPDLVIRLPSLLPKNLSGRVPTTTGEYYDGVGPASTRVALWPTPATFAACGDQAVATRFRLYSQLHTLPAENTGTLHNLIAPEPPNAGWFDSAGDLIEPPIRGVAFQPDPGFQQVNPDFSEEAHISNTLRQLLYKPRPIIEGGAGYNTSFLYRVCATMVQADLLRVCDKYSAMATVTLVVEPHDRPPTAALPAAITLRQGMDEFRGITVTLNGSDPEGARVIPYVVRVPGQAASCGDGGESCGTLYQVDAGGARGAAFTYH